MSKKLSQLILDEAKQVAKRGLIPVIQKLGFNANGKKEVVTGMRYKHLSSSIEALQACIAYIEKNPDSNALGVLMQDKYVNLDFDNLVDHKKFIEMKLISPPDIENTRITITASGKYHYIYQLPEGWFDKYNKTTHIGGMDTDVLFGTGNVEYIYPTTLPDGRQYGKNHIIQPSEMPSTLREYLEPMLNPAGISPHTRSALTQTREPINRDEYTRLESMLVDELHRFGYKDVSIVSKKDNGFDFTYDHSVPDPLDTSVIHDHIDGYVIVDEAENKAIVGTYSNACRRKNAFLCNLEDPEACLLDDTVDACTPTSMNIEYNEKFVQPFYEPVGAKVNIIHSDLGTGKTHQVEAFHKKHQPQSALILTPRVIFGQCLQEKLGDNWKLYLNARNPDGKFTADKLICQMESIWRVAENKVYEHIYVDEIESCLKQFSSSTMKDRRGCVETFERLLRSAKRIILCDAHISNRTTNLLKNLGFQNHEIVYEHNTYVARCKNAIQVDDQYQLLRLFIETLDSGKNIVFFSTSRKFIVDKLQPLIAERLLPSDYLVYLNDSDEKTELKHPELQWLNKRVVVYNSTITVGVDFNIPDVFDTMFVYAMNFGCGPVRDIFQAMHRVRRLKDDHIFYWISPRPEPGCVTVTTLLGAQRYVDEVTEYRNFNRAGAHAPLWLKDLHVINVLEEGLSKNRYAEMFDAYLIKTGYTKKKDISATADKPAEAPKREKIDYATLFGEIDDISWDEFIEFDQDLKYKKLKRDDYYKYCKKLYCVHYKLSDPNNFYLALYDRGRNILDHILAEKQNVKGCDIIIKQLHNDYLETISTDCYLVDSIRDMCKELGLRTSWDSTPFLETHLYSEKMGDLLKRVQTVYNLTPDHKVITQLSHIMKQWNDGGIEYCKSESGKTIKTKKINGKNIKLCQFTGQCFEK